MWSSCHFISCKRWPCKSNFSICNSTHKKHAQSLSTGRKRSKAPVLKLPCNCNRAGRRLHIWKCKAYFTSSVNGSRWHSFWHSYRIKYNVTFGENDVWLFICRKHLWNLRSVWDASMSNFISEPNKQHSYISHSMRSSHGGMSKLNAEKQVTSTT